MMYHVEHVNILAVRWASGINSKEPAAIEIPDFASRIKVINVSVS